MKFKVNPFFFVIWILFLVIGKSSSVLFLFLSAAVHEIVHIYVFTFFGAKLSVIELLPFGISARLLDETKVGYVQEIVCMLAGPVANLAMAGFCWLAQFVIVHIGPAVLVQGFDFLIVCNLCFALINLMPIYPLDGGRALFSFLESRLPIEKAEGISLFLSYVFLIFLLVGGISLIIYTGCNFSLLLIFGYLLMYLLIRRIA